MSDPSDPSDGERARIEEVYGSYRHDHRDRDRWDADAAGNRCILAERTAHLARLLASIPAPGRVLEVGCGGGGVIRELGHLLRATAGDATLVGVDLLADRLGEAHEAGCVVAQADGRRLPFADDSFDLVVTFTVLSSVLDPGLRDQLAAELCRVLRPGGHVLWYDMRYPSGNRNVRPIGRRGLRHLFPGLALQVRSTTVVPPLARRLGSRDRALYPWMARVPVLRSHLVGLLGEPDGPGPQVPPQRP